MPTHLLSVDTCQQRDQPAGGAVILDHIVQVYEPEEHVIPDPTEFVDWVRSPAGGWVIPVVLVTGNQVFVGPMIESEARAFHTTRFPRVIFTWPGRPE